MDGWSINNHRYGEGNLGVGEAVTGHQAGGATARPQWVTDEADGEDLPGAGFNAHETTGVVTPGIVSNGHLTPSLDRNYGLTGDYWHLDTRWGHSYRIEVKFGNSSRTITGGSAAVYFIDGDRRGTCCESDHNRNDGYTFMHVKHDRNYRYLVVVAVFDQLNAKSTIYNGPYTITMTDITGTDKVTTNLYLGTRSAFSRLVRQLKAVCSARSAPATNPAAMNSTESARI